MRVARLCAPGRIAVGDEPDPVAGPGESLIQVTSVGLCGSDLHWYGEGGIGDAVLATPLVLGHEIAGVVLDGPLAGRRVAVDPAIPDGTCAQCLDGCPNLCPAVRFAGHAGLDGGLRQRLSWPSHRLHPVPDSVGDDAVAMLEPLGVAVHAADLAHLRLGDTVAVVGLGPIGLLLVQLARAAGAGRVVAVEPLAHRRAAALRLGADESAEVATGAAVADVVFEVDGSPAAVAAAVGLARPGGRVVLVGIPAVDATVLPAAGARRKGLTFAVVRRMGEVYPRAIGLVERGVVDVDSVVSDVFGLEDVGAAFTAAAARTGLKVVVHP